MQIFATIIAGVIVFLLGQMLQQFLLAPIQEFGRQRADAIYFAVRFKDLMDARLLWDAVEKDSVKQMKAALIYSVELIPFYDFLSDMKIFGLPRRLKVREAAKKIGMLASIANSKSGATTHGDILIAQEIVTLLGAKISLREMEG
jgi:hypothetical protein